MAKIKNSYYYINDLVQNYVTGLLYNWFSLSFCILYFMLLETLLQEVILRYRVAQMAAIPPIPVGTFLYSVTLSLLPSRGRFFILFESVWTWDLL